MSDGTYDGYNVGSGSDGYKKYFGKTIDKIKKFFNSDERVIGTLGTDDPKIIKISNEIMQNNNLAIYCKENGKIVSRRETPKKVAKQHYKIFTELAKSDEQLLEYLYISEFLDQYEKKIKAELKKLGVDSETSKNMAQQMREYLEKEIEKGKQISEILEQQYPGVNLTDPWTVHNLAPEITDLYQQISKNQGQVPPYPGPYGQMLNKEQHPLNYLDKIHNAEDKLVYTRGPYVSEHERSGEIIKFISLCLNNEEYRKQIKPILEQIPMPKGKEEKIEPKIKDSIYPILDEIAQKNNLSIKYIKNDLSSRPDEGKLIITMLKSRIDRENRRY